jgi:hypothetical protein
MLKRLKHWGLRPFASSCFTSKPFLCWVLFNSVWCFVQLYRTSSIILLRILGNLSAALLSLSKICRGIPWHISHLQSHPFEARLCEVRQSVYGICLCSQNYSVHRHTICTDTRRHSLYKGCVCVTSFSIRFLVLWNLLMDAVFKFQFLRLHLQLHSFYV